MQQNLLLAISIIIKIITHSCGNYITSSGDLNLYHELRQNINRWHSDSGSGKNITLQVSRLCVGGGAFRGLIGSALDHRSLPPEFESHPEHI